MNYYPNYTCRLCGKTFANKEGYESNNMAALSRVVVVTVNPDSSYGKPTVHYCESGNIGLADFIGYAKE